MFGRRNGMWLNPKSDWLVRAVISGFAATVLMTVTFVAAYELAVSLGSNSPGSPLLARWLWSLSNNTVTGNAGTAVPIVVLLHFAFGITWAGIYAAIAEPRLEGPGWQRGLYFAALPGAVSLLVFLPLVGGGVLGLGLGAGPLPIIGNLVLHAVYGITLGHFYPAESDRPLIELDEVESPEEARILAHAEHVMALGVVGGLAIGGLLGLLGQVAINPGEPVLFALTIGAVAGSAAGALIGSFLGLSPQQG